MVSDELTILCAQEKVFSHQTLVEAVKKVDVVIAGHTVFQHELECQKKIIAAIKEAGNVKAMLYHLQLNRESID